MRHFSAFLLALLAGVAGACVLLAASATGADVSVAADSAPQNYAARLPMDCRPDSRDSFCDLLRRRRAAPSLLIPPRGAGRATGTPLGVLIP